MLTGRCSFLKRLGATLASFTVAGKLAAREKQLAPTYVRKYQENSLPELKPLQNVSGCYIATGCSPVSGKVSVEMAEKLREEGYWP